MAASMGSAVHVFGVSFTLPVGWVISYPIQGSQEGCLHPASPPGDAPSWFGCAGVWVANSTTDPAHPAAPQNPGQVWYMSDGVLPCPYPGSPPNDVVPTPGTLVHQGDRVVGAVDYRWYQWSAECVLSGSSGAAPTRNFSADVWWLQSPGVVFADVTGHPETQQILASVRVDGDQTGGSGPTTTVNPAIANPISGVEFRSPSNNIHCELDYGPQVPTSEAFCFSSSPAESATLSDTGTYRVCSGETCLANPAQNEIELPYGQHISLGPFTCTSSSSGMTCLAEGRGFEISRSGITAVP